ncbi:MAG: VOC family protein [Acidimicrobiales bacterium]|nr:VOC family protein [Acidimicrobiales bacterium]
MPRIHHTAITTVDVEASLAFWRDGIGLAVLMDASFDGDWPTLLRAPSDRLRSIFLGDPEAADAGIIELVAFAEAGSDADAGDAAGPPRPGVLLVSLFADVDATLARLDGLGLAADVRRISASGIDMAVVVDPNGVAVELLQPDAAANLDQLQRPQHEGT